MKLGALLKPLRDRWIHRSTDVAHYIANGRKPWSRGYDQYKNEFIRKQLGDASVLKTFRESRALPDGYGLYLDERVIEYVWLFSRLDSGPGRLLDAGSALNHSYLLEHCSRKNITVLTLEPENQCHWQSRVSYVFEDLRDLPFKDEWFDDVVSISTIEHVGKDNTAHYSANPKFKEDDNAGFLDAVRELQRVCKRGGKVFVTVPYGRHVDYGWYHQFDAETIERLLCTFAPSQYACSYYHYTATGWQIASAAECADAVGFDIHRTRYMDSNLSADYDPDFAAASRAIAALELWK